MKNHQPRKNPSKPYELFIGSLIGLGCAVLFYFGFLADFENLRLDKQFLSRGTIPVSEKVQMVIISDECISRIGPWPWPRKTHGRLLDILKADGARVVAFDIMFNGPSAALDTEDDAAFVQKIKEAGNVLLPVTFSQALVLDNKTGDMVQRMLPVHPYEPIRNACAGEGFIDVENQMYNRDGVIRQVHLERAVQGETFFHLSLLAASRFLQHPIATSPAGIKIGDVVLPPYRRWERGQHEGPVTSYMLNYAGPSGHCPETYYSEVLTNHATGTFKDKFVIVGFRAKGTSPDDLKVSPYGVIAGVEVHANLVNNILTGRILQRFSPGWFAAGIFLFSLIFGWLIALRPGKWAGAIAVIALWSGVWILGRQAFQQDIIFEIVPFIILIPVQFVVACLIQHIWDLYDSNADLSQKNSELKLINEVSKAVTFMGDLEKTLEVILSRLVQELDAERGSIFLLDEKYESLIEKTVIYGARGAVKQDVEMKAKFQLGEGIAGEVFSKGETRIINNVSTDPNLKSFFAACPTVHSMLCIPLKVREMSFGVMNIVNKLDGDFADNDLQTALTMANQASVLIENARLFNLATIDGLTGLAVHRYFQSKLEEEFRRGKRYDKPLSLIMTDIDHFKKFNDTWGHQTGDMVLREVAKCVRSTIRDTDIAARYGGEEFAVVLPETDVEGAKLLAERLRQKVESSVYPGPSGDLRVAISLGVSSIPLNPAETTADMIKLADEALYAAKHGGRNQVRVSEARVPPIPA
jgi:diguanylate cyclase (GGDEF)-like protein